MTEFEQMKERDANYSLFFEKQAKELFCNLSRLKTSPLDAQQDPYLAGYSKILDSALEDIKAFIDEDNLRKDYPKMFKEKRKEYHQMHLDLKKSAKCDFNDGSLTAAHTLYEGLDAVIQNAAEFDLKQLQKLKQQRKSVRR